MECPEYVRLQTIVDLLNISIRTAYRWIKEDKFPIPVTRLGEWQWQYVRRVDAERFFGHPL
jgi:predicted site-specific integrase-resolvase